MGSASRPEGSQAVSADAVGRMAVNKDDLKELNETQEEISKELKGEAPLEPLKPEFPKEN